VLSVVLVHDKLSSSVEHVIGQCVQEIIPEDRLEKFEEFHACELYGGYGVFDGIEQDKRFSAITTLLSVVDQYKIPIICGAVDLKRLRMESFASAVPIDVAFRLCIPAIEELMSKRQHESGPEFALLILDDMDKDKKTILKKSFRELRKPIRPPHWHPGTWHIHDDMYFGSSKDSIGIQIADLCSYFIGKHLEKDQAAEGFYQMFANRIESLKVDPR